MLYPHFKFTLRSHLPEEPLLLTRIRSRVPGLVSRHHFWGRSRTLAGTVALLPSFKFTMLRNSGIWHPILSSPVVIFHIRGSNCGRLLSASRQCLTAFNMLCRVVSCLQTPRDVSPSRCSIRIIPFCPDDQIVPYLVPRPACTDQTALGQSHRLRFKRGMELVPPTANKRIGGIW
jgi:hypothetical protein